MRNQVLDYYLHDGPTEFRVELVGTMNDEGARRLEQVWRTAGSLIGDRRPIVDMTFVSSVDEQGRALLASWHGDGARFIANSKASRALAESIFGAAPSELAPKTRRWVPFRIGFCKSAAGVPCLLAAALLFTLGANAATLKPETVAAWDDYVATAKADLVQRIRPGGCYLWTFENPERAAQVRAGQIVVAPAPGPSPKKVPGGLIHHWIGAMFLPGLTIGQVLEVTRDYDRYKDYYQPVVAESKTVARDDANDEFSMRIVNRMFFATSALDAEYEAMHVRLDEHRMYTISRTTRLQEIEDAGQASEHRQPEGEGGGYIWKLFSVTRLDQRDGGVYVELEAIALSRDIPVAARFFVDPIVRRVSHNSILISLEQTEHALRENPALTARRAPVVLSLKSN
jgi:hypothetical protein